MKLHRVALGIILGLGFSVAAIAQDRIIYKDGKVFPAEGSGQKVKILKETYSVIKYELKVRGQPIEQTVATSKVARVEYGSMPFAYKEALDNYNNAYFEDALDQFVDLAASPPKPWTEQYCLYYIGECNFNLGRFAEAIDAYKDLMARASDSKFVPEARLKMGMALLRKGDKVAAQAEFNGLKQYTIEKGYPDVYGSRAELGLISILEADNTFAEALRRLEALKRSVSDDHPDIAAECQLRIGLVYIGQGSYPKAEDYFKSILGSAEGSDPATLYGAYLGLGNCYVAQSRFKDALKDCFLRIVVCQDRKANVPLAILAESLFRAGKCWDQLREENPAYVNFAQDLYKECMRLAPGSKWAVDSQKLLRRR